MVGLQQAACGWAGEDYSAAGFAELAWALASCGHPLSGACCQLLHSALQEGEGSSISADNSQQQQQQQQKQQPPQQQGSTPVEVDRGQLDGTQSQQHAQVPESGRVQLERGQVGAASAEQSQGQQQQQQQQRQQQQKQDGRQRDWQSWFEGTPPSRVVLLLWSAARLGCQPCSSCLQAAAAAALHHGSGLASLPIKVG